MSTPASGGDGGGGGAGEEDKKPMDQAAQIILKVKRLDGNEVFFGIKRSTQLRKLMAAYCDRHAVDMNTIVFLFDGRRLQGKQTPDELEMEDGDEIYAMAAMIHQSYWTWICDESRKSHVVDTSLACFQNWHVFRTGRTGRFSGRLNAPPPPNTCKNSKTSLACFQNWQVFRSYLQEFRSLSYEP